MTVENRHAYSGVTPEEALTQCLDAMEKGSQLPFQDGLRKRIGEKARRQFVENHYQWERFKDTVLRSARQIGTFAEAFARFEGEISNLPATEIKEHHADEAIRVVRKLCPAGLMVGPRFRWCPEA